MKKLTITILFLILPFLTLAQDIAMDIDQTKYVYIHTQGNNFFYNSDESLCVRKNNHMIEIFLRDKGTFNSSLIIYNDGITKYVEYINVDRDLIFRWNDPKRIPLVWYNADNDTYEAAFRSKDFTIFFTVERN